ncbi:hypothetical protein OQA88_1465 [Cercophora sp. LCS_1]
MASGNKILSVGVSDHTGDNTTSLPSSPKDDVEKAASLDTDAQERLDKLRNTYGATWDSPDDPEDPFNWSAPRKVSIGVIFSLGQLITLMSASMIAAALDSIKKDLDINASTAQIIFSTYFLGMAFGPFIIAAWAETSGRKQVWLFANAWYILWNAVCPIGNSKVLMIVGRLMTGAGASVGVTVDSSPSFTQNIIDRFQLTGPVMTDVYREEERGKSLAIVSFLPYLGPALGPIIGGLVTQLIDWQWIFWVMCIVNAVVTILGLVFIKETYTPVLLRRKAAKTAPLGGGQPGPSLRTRLSGNFARPFNLLLKRPVIQVVSVLLAIDFGIYVFLLSTFATLYISRYGQAPSTASLHYISISIGSTLAAQVGGHIMDCMYRRLRDRSPTKQGKPEFRAPWMVPGMILLPAGLFWYGWSAERRLPWIMVDIGAAILTLGSFVFSQALLTYQLDEFAEHGASANAASRFLSNLFAFGFPIFAPRLYHCLGYGWGNSLLAFVWLVLVGPVPLLVWLRGDRLRALGRGK